ncbi:MAG: preprotein translocase subunit SecA, partial [Alphaproteobacteria bacterium]|nr:preprotein translocase subunit SecA [Alphaproteobacteria bacterium]
RDMEWMGIIYQGLGLTVGAIQANMDPAERQKAYASDITYGTNNEFGFDYLRDNMKFRLDEMVQRGFNYAIVDEVDSILIDEARTPLIISGPAEDSSELYISTDKLMSNLKPVDYDKDEKRRSVALTEAGSEKFEKLIEEAGLIREGGTLYDANNISLVHHLNQAVKAHTLFEKDKDYIVKDGGVIIIDEFTGRMMEGRRYSDGLHQALEAKEGVAVQLENQTLASVTFQNYFRLYKKLSGMTGTALTEAAEFGEIYGLEVVDIPTNMPLVRKDQDDEIYRTSREKDAAILEEIGKAQKRNQPILVGTISIEKSEHLANLLQKKKIPHKVLNARYHEQEAKIIANAGAPGSVTIATNMAGRGTDIQLGGNLEMRLADRLEGIEDAKQIKKITAEVEKEIVEAAKVVKAAGGLYVIATERHESRRIDNQLRGRSARQGDPGLSKFYLSLEDDLMRIFGSERLDSVLKKLGLEEGEAITHPWINKALEKAQQKVEARNFDIRKHLLKYDNVMNDQRKAIYEQRREIMEAEDVQDTILDMREEYIRDLVREYIPEHAYSEQWDAKGLQDEAHRILAMELPIVDWSKEEGIADVEITERLTDAVNTQMADKEERFGAHIIRMAEKTLLLRIVDQIWKEHLLTLDQLREGINLRAYGQRDPLNEYKHEAFMLFHSMLDRLRQTITGAMSHLDLGEAREEDVEIAETPKQRMNASHDAPQSAFDQGKEADDEAPVAPVRNRKSAEQIDPSDQSTWGRVRRNDVCPCGSRKKYKHCHGSV